MLSEESGALPDSQPKHLVFLGRQQLSPAAAKTANPELDEAPNHKLSKKTAFLFRANETATLITWLFHFYIVN